MAALCTFVTFAQRWVLFYNAGSGPNLHLMSGNPSYTPLSADQARNRGVAFDELRHASRVTAIILQTDQRECTHASTFIASKENSKDLLLQTYQPISKWIIRLSPTWPKTG